MNRKTRVWLLLISPLVLITGVLVARIIFVGIGHYSVIGGYDGQFKLRSKMISGPASKDQISSWQKGPFVDVNAPVIFSVVKNAVKSTAELSVKQNEELQDSIIRFFHAFSIGGFDNYFEFKTHGARY